MRPKRHTVQFRLWRWGGWVQLPREDIARSSSPFGRIAEERNAAGNQGDGIRYEIVDGVSCPPDGGMSRAVEHAGRAISRSIQCREVHEAVSFLPERMRQVTIETYVVARGEDPRSARSVAERMGLDESTVREALKAAHERVSRRIYGPFELA